MKQLFFLVFVLFCMSRICRAQDSLHISTPKTSTEKNMYSMPQKNSKDYYLEKANKLNTSAWVLLSAGVVSGVAGIIIYDNTHNVNGWNQVSYAFGGVFLMIAGSALVVTSIPIFIRAGYYKNKALDMSAILKFEPYLSGVTIKQYPAIGVRFRL
jgi:hypothetical protein